MVLGPSAAQGNAPVATQRTLRQERATNENPQQHGGPAGSLAPSPAAGAEPRPHASSSPEREAHLRNRFFPQPVHALWKQIKAMTVQRASPPDLSVPTNASGVPCGANPIKATTANGKPLLHANQVEFSEVRQNGEHGDKRIYVAG